MQKNSELKDMAYRIQTADANMAGRKALARATVRVGVWKTREGAAVHALALCARRDWRRTENWTLCFVRTARARRRVVGHEQNDATMMEPTG